MANTHLKAGLLTVLLVLGALASSCVGTGASRPPETRCAESAAHAYNESRYNCAFRIAPSTVAGHEIRAKVAIRFGKLERAEKEIKAALDSLESAGRFGGQSSKTHLRSLLQIIETPRHAANQSATQ